MAQPDGAGEALVAFHLYATRSRLYLVGRNESRTAWRLLKFSRGPGLEVSEDCSVYGERECSRLLQEIDDGNRNVGGLKLLCTAHGVAGCVRFLEGYYLLLITERRCAPGRREQGSRLGQGGPRPAPCFALFASLEQLQGPTSPCRGCLGSHGRAIERTDVYDLAGVWLLRQQKVYTRTW